MKSLSIYENTVLTRSGEERLIAWNNTVVRDADGKIIGTMASGEDITERKKLEKDRLAALRNTDALLKASRAVLQEPDFEKAARAIFDICKDHIGATAGYFAILSDDEKNNEVMFLEAGCLSCTVNPELPMPIRGLRAEAYQKGRAVFNNNFKESKHWKLMPKGHVGLDNVLFAPVILDGKAMGLIGVANKPGGFTMQDAGIAEAFGEIAAVAMREHQTKEALRSSEERHRTLFESSQDAIMTLAPPSWKFTSGNPATLKMFKVKDKNEFTTLAPWDLAPEMQPSGVPSSDKAKEVIEKAMTEGSCFFDWIHKRLNGEIFPATVLLNRVELGGEISLQGTVRDVSAQKSAQAERERLTMAIEQAGEMVVITDPDGLIQYVNPVFERITGYTREEVLGQNPRFLKSGEHDDAFYQDLWETISRGQTWRGRMINRCKDGSLFTEDSTISPVVDSAGNITNYVAVKNDITEHLRIGEEKAQMEKQARQTGKLESIGRLAGGVAHDFNNALTPMLVISGFILNDMDENDPMREDIQDIRDAGERCASLTRQLLAFSRKQALDMITLNLNDVVINIEKLLARVIGEDIELFKSLDPDLGNVSSDVGQIEQIVVNLAVNSRDAMPTGGKLEIKTENIYLDEKFIADHQVAAPGNYVMLSMSDTGTGIDKETQTQIFEPFFTTKEKGKGTGLGLSTVYGIVKQSGGSIFCESEPGEGTTFKIYLPLIEDEITEVRNQHKQEETYHGSETVLVVEDEYFVRKVAERILKSNGYHVLEAESGEDALRLCRNLKTRSI